MTIGNLAKALAAAQGAIEGAHKDRTNPHFGSAYATLDSVWNACRKPLSDNGLAVIQMPECSGNVVTVRTVLVHESGEQIESACEAVARDASPQAIGACITYLRRYSLASFVGVAPEDDDANAAQPPAGQAPARQATRPAPTNGTAPKFATKETHAEIVRQLERAMPTLEAGKAKFEALTGIEWAKRNTLSPADAARIIADLASLPAWQTVPAVNPDGSLSEVGEYLADPEESVA